LEKKTGMWRTDTRKKLSCRKSLCEKHSMQQKENGRRGHFPRKYYAYQTRYENRKKWIEIASFVVKHFSCFLRTRRRRRWMEEEGEDEIDAE